MTDTQQDTRTRIEIVHDESADDPVANDDGAPIIVSQGKWCDPSIHEQMRGISCAVRVDVPGSQTNRSAGAAVAYATPAHVREWYGEDTPETREKTRTSLEAFGREWRNWADGYSFGYVLTRERVCGECGTWEEVETDSCWGYITDEPSELIEWMDTPDDDARAALRDAIDNHWDGGYPVAARGVHPAEDAPE